MILSYVVVVLSIFCIISIAGFIYIEGKLAGLKEGRKNLAEYVLKTTRRE
ncbi:MAG: hypothetical protein M0R03_19375 [Novosphingobium sp.]|nr:hypothetical protein [Novosphingobium sp.]